MLSVAEPCEVPEALAARLRVAGGPCVATLGTFDGVHRGHRALLAQAAGLAADRGLAVVAVTFTPRAEQVFRPETALPDICSIDERVRRLRRAGADRVAVLPFSRAVAAVPYDVFAALLVTHLDARVICVGEDFALGRGREGTPDRLRALGLEVHTARLVTDPGGEKVSSTAIRRATAA